jgi:aspartyl protease
LTVARLANLAVGPAHVENLPVLVQDLAGLRKIDSHIEGIAGQDFLSHFNYLIDYWKRSVRFEQGDEIRGSVQGDSVPIEVSGHRMIIASETQSVGHANLRFLLDSGANSVVLLPRASQAINLPVQESRDDVTSSGRVELKVGRIRMLKVGSQEFHDLTVALTASEPAARIGDGLLPTALFKSLYVNNQKGFVMFNPRPKKN